MMFNMNNAGIASNIIYNQIKVVSSQPISNQSKDKPKSTFVIKSTPTFSTSSSNKNINYIRKVQTKNGK